MDLKGTQSGSLSCGAKKGGARQVHFSEEEIFFGDRC